MDGVSPERRTGALRSASADGVSPDRRTGALKSASADGVSPELNRLSSATSEAIREWGTRVSSQQALQTHVSGSPRTKGANSRLQWLHVMRPAS